jgi:hypothetical protein
VAAPAESGVASAESTTVATTETTSVSAAGMTSTTLRPHGNGQTEGERRDAYQATHTNSL